MDSPQFTPAIRNIPTRMLAFKLGQLGPQRVTVVRDVEKRLNHIFPGRDRQSPDVVDLRQQLPVNLVGSVKIPPLFRKTYIQMFIASFSEPEKFITHPSKPQA